MTSSFTRGSTFFPSVATAVVALASVLAGCGGGGDAGGGSATPASADTSTAQAVAPADSSSMSAALAVPAGAFRATMVSVPTGNCADVTHSSLDDTTRLQEWQCNGSAAQAFDFKPVANRANTYYIVNANSGKCVSTYRFDIDQYTCPAATDATLTMMWTLRAVNAAANEYQIVRTSDIGSGQERCITGTGAGARMTDWVCNTTPGTQTWRVVSGKV